MRTNSRAAAMTTWMPFTSVALAGVGQEKIPELQRAALKNVESETPADVQ